MTQPPSPGPKGKKSRDLSSFPSSPMDTDSRSIFKVATTEENTFFFREFLTTRKESQKFFFCLSTVLLHTSTPIWYSAIVYTTAAYILQPFVLFFDQATKNAPIHSVADISSKSTVSVRVLTLCRFPAEIKNRYQVLFSDRLISLSSFPFSLPNQLTGSTPGLSPATISIVPLSSIWHGH